MDAAVLLPQLTFRDVSSVAKLHEALVPLLHGRVQPEMFSVLIPSVLREDGSSTKSFLFLVGLRKLPDTELQGLFSSGRVEPSCMSSEQRTTYEAWNEKERATYACLYSKAEWKENERQCHNVYSAQWTKVSPSASSWSTRGE